nr:hypothetical protein [Ensifer sp. ENS12]
MAGMEHPLLHHESIRRFSEPRRERATEVAGAETNFGRQFANAHRTIHVAKHIGSDKFEFTVAECRFARRSDLFVVRWPGIDLDLRIIAPDRGAFAGL